MLTYTADASGVDLRNAVTVTEVEDTDPNAAASFNTPTEELADLVEALRVDGGTLMFGNYSDGNATLDGSTNYNSFSSRSGSVYTLTRNAFLLDLTINSNVELKTAGFVVHVFRKLTMTSTNPKISCNGNAGSGVTAGAAVGGIIGGVAAGGNGGAGGGANNGTAGDSVTIALGGAGAAGGNGAGGGGSGGTSTAPTATVGSIQQQPSLTTGFLFGASGLSIAKGGAGGGGGGGGTGAGGGGGGPGGILILNARIVEFSASALLEAKGGAGGNASGGNTAGGGGGGGGGCVIVNYRHKIGSVSPNSCIVVTGGAGGTATSGGSAGSTGSAGTSYVCQF